MYRFLTIAFLLIFMAAGCRKQNLNPDEKPVKYRNYQSLEELRETFLQIGRLSDPVVRTQILNEIWDSLKANKKIPFVKNDSVAFLYRGDTDVVKWLGDFNSWSTQGDQYSGYNPPGTDVWIMEGSFPADARLDYKIFVNDSWILDPANPYIQYSGFGPNSELRMPDWKFPQETLPIPGATTGSLGSVNLILSTTAIPGYRSNYRVYTPYNYANLTNLPVLYVTDGHEYTDSRLGAMVTILDNLIYQQKIEPLVVVFIDPREPGNSSNNRRMFEYRANISYANFIADELVPLIDAAFKTDARAEKRGILGTSLGGWNSAFFGLYRNDAFRLLVIQSPAFDQNIIYGYQNSPLLPLKIYMCTGVINDTEAQARQMKTILEQKGYSLSYREVNQGHSWGNWKGLIGEALQYLYPKQ